MKVIAIAAMDEARVIGKGNKLPWHLPEDMKRFSKLTKGHTVLMGRRTFESLLPSFKPLPNRKNIVITRDPSSLASFPDVVVWESPEGCIEACLRGEIELPSDILWIVGGEQIYRATVGYWDEVYLTLVQGKHEGDAFFPRFEDDFELVESASGTGCSFLNYKRVSGKRVTSDN